MRRAVNYLILLIRLAAKRSTRREGKDQREEEVIRTSQLAKRRSIKSLSCCSLDSSSDCESSESDGSHSSGSEEEYSKRRKRSKRGRGYKNSRKRTRKRGKRCKRGKQRKLAKRSMKSLFFCSSDSSSDCESSESDSSDSSSEEDKSVSKSKSSSLINRSEDFLNHPENISRELEVVSDLCRLARNERSMRGCLGSYLDKEGESLSKDCGDDVEANAKMENLDQNKTYNQSLMFQDLMESHKKAALNNDLVIESHKHSTSSEADNNIAQLAQLGRRIPPRGEVGLSADQIRRFEELGNAMSGNRHQRMNPIRIRKENNVYNPEDRRALAEFTYDEKIRREAKVMADLRKLVDQHGAKDLEF